MRINVYAEEITNEVEIVRKTVNQQLFYGVRVFLKSPPELHYGTSDDDRTGITFWVPWTKASGNDPRPTLDMLEKMFQALHAFAKERGDL